jgi:predicted MFS family arabinose efflux permease
VGRIGSIIGPIFGGIMVSHAWTLQHIFFGGALPALAAALAIVASATLGDRQNPYGAKRYADPA